MKKLYSLVLILALLLVLPACGAGKRTASATPDSESSAVPATQKTDTFAGTSESEPATEDLSDGELPSIELTMPDNGDNAGQTTSPVQSAPSIPTVPIDQPKPYAPSSGNQGSQGPTTTPHTHVVVKDDAVEPTCQRNGLTEGSHCSACGAVLVSQQIIPAVDHSYASGQCIWCGEKDPAEQDNGEIELPEIPLF